MTRPLSILVALFAVVAVIMLIGFATRAPGFAALRDGLGRQARSATDVLDEGAEKAADEVG
ncbi:MAG TPA: hypothetical protein VK831_03525 [Candidatus Deferrimicrobiaceae bacterium]|nr:hypothetical protein [Candidatus Deferrimicrobiaceae bacterium]